MIDNAIFSATLYLLGRYPKRKEQMATFQVNITITSYGETTIEADSLEEAKQLAEDLVAGDFDFIDGSDDEREVLLVKESN
jgi:hypothetical protein